VSWRLFNVSVKAHPAHGAVQPFIAPLDALRAEGVHGSRRGRRSRWSARPTRARTGTSTVRPATVLGAQYSVPFLARPGARVYGAEGLLTLDDAGLRDETVLQPGGQGE
jgi:hypothetical protein